MISICLSNIITWVSALQIYEYDLDGWLCFREWAQWIFIVDCLQTLLPLIYLSTLNAIWTSKYIILQTASLTTSLVTLQRSYLALWPGWSSEHSCESRWYSRLVFKPGIVPRNSQLGMWVCLICFRSASLVGGMWSTPMVLLVNRWIGHLSALSSPPVRSYNSMAEQSSLIIILSVLTRG